MGDVLAPLSVEDAVTKMCRATSVARGAKSVKTAVLLEKPGKRAVQIHPDYVGFTCPDVFVIGYGMDVAHSYRQLPFVGVLDHHDKDPDLFDKPE